MDTIDVHLVKRLIAEQFPQWADLPVRRVENDGWDNRTFRLGDDLSVRLPSAARYSSQPEREHRWLPYLAPFLPLSIPLPLKLGEPARDYPFHWSVCRWLLGENAAVARITDLPAFAANLAEFLSALRRIDPGGGPAPGPHNFFRGGDLAVYDGETRRSIAILDRRIDARRITALWESALHAAWLAPPVWFHGDVSAGNLLVREGKLCAVIDFGNAGVGDPACDLTIAWTFFSKDSRQTFRASLALDDATWTRARGWALWKALITWTKHLDANTKEASAAERVVEELLSDS